MVCKIFETYEKERGKNMKKTICSLLSAVLLVGFSGCSKTDENTSSAQKSSSVSQSSKESITSNYTSQVSSGETVTSEQQTIAGLDDTTIQSLENTKKGWGQGTNVDKDNRPVSCGEYQTKYGKYGAVYIGENTKKIYLTFDEGYENGYTPKILDALKDKKASAVFFVTYDYAKKNPDLIKRMIAENHIVGNHSYTHPSMPTVTVQKAKEEIQKLHDYVFENFKYKMTLFRPPMGEYSERTLAITQALGYKSIFWSYAYKDWDPNSQIGAAKAFEKVTKAAHNGVVYLLHAVSKDNAEILPSVIDDLRKKGFEISKFDL
ncbi:MAG: polysaccharide deacetylase [Oscillospiraceae bacterium]|nr:polysaccharide deacetylase [Oscillospiraceae bacterium]